MKTYKAIKNFTLADKMRVLINTRKLSRLLSKLIFNLAETKKRVHSDLIDEFILTFKDGSVIHVIDLFSSRETKFWNGKVWS